MISNSQGYKGNLLCVIEIILSLFYVRSTILYIIMVGVFMLKSIMLEYSF